MNNDRGILIESTSHDCTIISNQFVNNDGVGAYIYGDKNIFEKNIFSYNGGENKLSTTDGVSLYGDNNIFLNNTFEYNAVHGVLVGGNNNTFIGNVFIHNNYTGVYFTTGCYTNQTFINNTFINDGGILFSSDTYNNHIVNNTIDGKKIVYLENASNQIVEGDAGQVIALNCHNVTIKKFTLSNITAGIQIIKTSNSKVINNTIKNCTYGIISLGKNSTVLNINNLIKNNVIHGETFIGIYLVYSQECNVENNFISNLVYPSKNIPHYYSPLIPEGLRIIYSPNVTIKNNTFFNIHYSQSGIDYGNAMTMMAEGNTTVVNNTFNDLGYGAICGGYYGYNGTAKIHVHFNKLRNISEEGINIMNNFSLIEINATYNYWGTPSGPYHPVLNKYGQGPTIADNVTFNPWLLKPNDTQYDYTLSLKPGWNLISTPKILNNSYTTLTTIIPSGLQLAYRYNSTSEEWETTTKMPQPLEAIFIRVSNYTGIGFKWTDNPLTPPPSRELPKSWSLIGPNMDISDFENGLPADEILISINDTSYGYQIVYSPTYNSEAWSATYLNSGSKKMKAFEGYWVFMNSKKTLAGRTI